MALAKLGSRNLYGSPRLCAHVQGCQQGVARRVSGGICSTLARNCPAVYLARKSSMPGTGRARSGSAETSATRGAPMGTWRIFVCWTGSFCAAWWRSMCSRLRNGCWAGLFLDAARNRGRNRDRVHPTVRHNRKLGAYRLQPPANRSASQTS